MRDHFREDENELPYLVWQRRDRDEDRGQSYSDTEDFEPIKISFNNILYSQFSSYVRRLQLTREQKARLISCVEIKPRNCTFSLNQNGDDIRITFRIENEYLDTEITVSYDPFSGSVEYRYGYTHHDRLQSMKWFRDAVNLIERQNGYKYEFCYEGHDFSTRTGRLVVNDSFKTCVMFEKDGDDDHYGYKVNFASRRLEEYKTYPFHEYHLFF